VNIVTLFDTQVAERPDQPALIDATGRGDDLVSFQALSNRSHAVAMQLHRDGIQPGDRVLVALPVSTDLYATLLGLWRLGAVAVFPDPGASRTQWAACFDRVQAQAFVAVAKAHLLRVLMPSLRRIPRHYATSLWLPATQRLATRCGLEPHPTCDIDPDSPSLITFTSGSTGEPKAASRSHRFLIDQYRVVQRTLDLAPGQRDITTLPVFVLANLAAGVSTLLPPGNLRQPGHIPPQPVWAAIERHRIQRASGSPAFFEQLRVGQSNHSPYRLDRIHTGGAPVTPALMRELASLTWSSDVTAVYGSTEAEPIAELALSDLTVDHHDGPVQGRGLPVGRPVPDIELRILQTRDSVPLGELSVDTFNDITCAPGNIGEIVVAGRHVLPGYLDGRGDADTKFSVEDQPWHRTGDLGYRDEHGDLWLLGRQSAAVTTSDRRIAPFELEYPAMASPGVARAAMFQSDDGPWLVIEPLAGASPSPVAVAERLPYDFPTERIRVVETIPLDSRHNAKVDYGALKNALKPL